MRGKSVVLLAAVLVFALAPVMTLAQGTAVEDFNYLPGSLINGQNGGTGWGGVWSTLTPGSFTVTNGGLTFPGLLTSGNALTTAIQGSQWNYSLRPTSSSWGGAGTTTWAQYLIRPESGYGQWGTFVLGGSYMAADTVQFGLGTQGGQRYLFIQQGLTGTPQMALYNWQPGHTYFVQGKLVVDGSGNANMTAYLWADNSGPVTSVSYSLPSWIGSSQWIQLYSSGGYTYDEFCIGSNCTPPVPEAGTMVALGSFLSMGGLFLRRRFSKS